MSKQPEARILLVDDDEAKRYTIAKPLERAGFLINEAASGADALRMVASLPDLVILDVKLPDLSGFEVCRRIKSDPVTASIPVLHVSSTFVDIEDKVHGLNCGADGYLTSVAEPLELVATVRASCAPARPRMPPCSPRASGKPRLMPSATAPCSSIRSAWSCRSTARSSASSTAPGSISSAATSRLSGINRPSRANHSFQGCSPPAAGKQQTRAWATAGCTSRLIPFATPQAQSRAPCVWFPTSRLENKWKCSYCARPSASRRPASARTSFWPCSPTSFAIPWRL